MSALRYLKDVMFNVTNGDRPDVANVAVVLMVGATRDVDVAESDVQAVREAGITLYGVGLGRSSNDRLLDELASSPDAVFTADDVMELNQSVALAVQRGVCDG